MIHQETVFTTRIIPLDPRTDELIGGKAEDQFRRIYTNLKIVLEESGSSLDRIIKQNIYLTNMEDFWAFTLSQKSFSVVLLGRLCRFLRCPRVLLAE
ncbi:hypothetical protein CNBG_10120 [Cryptococcus deuterogattii R265]|uniref:uncharacterized protein n=1 Tax=Cryptococcus deuterogattii (strain R265) TaxID=294750 RepID=UPI0019366D93|nr:hypothetical protein CNBG_10120 [Cryptococcus deuterogattii R265]